MSNMIMDLVGQRCSIKNEDEEFLTGNAEIACHVLAADDEWIKIAYVDRAGNRVIRLERVETLGSVIVFEDFRAQ